MQTQVASFNNPAWFHPYMCIQTENHRHWICLKFWSFLLYCLLSPKLTTHFCQERAASFPFPFLGKDQLKKNFQTSQCYSISGVTMYPIFSLSGWLLMLYLVMVQPPFFPRSNLARIFHSSIRFTSSSQPGRGPVKRNVWKHVPMNTPHSDKHWLITQKKTYIFI